MIGDFQFLTKITFDKSRVYKECQNRRISITVSIIIVDEMRIWPDPSFFNIYIINLENTTDG